uniref:Uncharacterized protein n=1 Tax=Corethron hystrix TaxID=216773 RepID=A0A7S1G2D3_9STRA|mmetsp:Transcript_8742/g.19232  ORF Transcript_8742/g.19232 Transcript_8742/m.19232 type:complete len:193 (+) Transcript_8742:497-1075(+)
MVCSFCRDIFAQYFLVVRADIVFLGHSVHARAGLSSLRTTKKDEKEALKALARARQSISTYKEKMVQVQKNLNAAGVSQRRVVQDRDRIENALNRRRRIVLRVLRRRANERQLQTSKLEEVEMGPDTSLEEAGDNQDAPVPDRLEELAQKEMLLTIQAKKRGERAKVLAEREKELKRRARKLEEELEKEGSN